MILAALGGKSAWPVRCSSFDLINLCCRWRRIANATLLQKFIFLHSYPVWLLQGASYFMIWWIQDYYWSHARHQYGVWVNKEKRVSYVDCPFIPSASWRWYYTFLPIGVHSWFIQRFQQSAQALQERIKGQWRPWPEPLPDVGHLFAFLCSSTVFVFIRFRSIKRCHQPYRIIIYSAWYYYSCPGFTPVCQGSLRLFTDLSIRASSGR